MIRRPPRSTLFPYTDALPISKDNRASITEGTGTTAGTVTGNLRDDNDATAGTDSDPDDALTSLSVTGVAAGTDRKSTRLNSSHANSSNAGFCLKKKCNEIGIA